MTAGIIDGKAIAAALRAEITAKVARLKDEHGITPGLAVVLVGDDPASQVYVASKTRQTSECGMKSLEFRLAADASETELLSMIDTLNQRPDVHGILVQLPLPGHINEQAVLQRIHPAKDVDGFTPVNVGTLSLGLPALVPCTPQGCILLIKSALPDLSGKHAVVIGRSNIVGKPLAQLLLRENCTVTIAHSKTANLPEICRQADILAAAVGRPEFVKGDWVKPGAVVIDVGINRVDGKLVGDVDFAASCKNASAITPVPGGVGPMTIACLLKNTYEAAHTLNHKNQ